MQRGYARSAIDDFYCEKKCVVAVRLSGIDATDGNEGRHVHGDDGTPAGRDLRAPMSPAVDRDSATLPVNGEQSLSNRRTRIRIGHNPPHCLPLTAILTRSPNLSGAFCNMFATSARKARACWLRYDRKTSRARKLDFRTIGGAVRFLRWRRTDEAPRADVEAEPRRRPASTSRSCRGGTMPGTSATPTRFRCISARPAARSSRRMRPWTCARPRQLASSAASPVSGSRDGGPGRCPTCAS